MVVHQLLLLLRLEGLPHLRESPFNKNHRSSQMRRTIGRFHLPAAAILLAFACLYLIGDRVAVPTQVSSFTTKPTKLACRFFSVRSIEDVSAPGRGATSNRSKIHLSTTASSNGTDGNSAGRGTSSESGLRGQLRKMTGFSLTALRKTLRLATGISLTAIYASTVATTGAWIRQTMKVILSVFPPWFRYFVQPFLILYYAPLFILRNLTGPTRKRAVQTHESFLEGWKEAVKLADKKSNYWPITVSEDGYIEKTFEDVDMNEALVESVEVSLEYESGNEE